MRSLKAKDPTAAKARDKLFAKAGIHGEGWHHGCGLGTDCIGMAYATPVSDGQRVYVTTTFSGAACFDFDGNQKWLAFMPTTGKTEAYARSPLLYRDLLLSDTFGKLVAFDKATGVVRRMVETQGGSIATPAIVAVAGTDILLSEGKQADGGSVTATRLPDGKPLRVVGWGIGGTQILADPDRRDVAYFCGRGQHSFWTEKEMGQPAKRPLPVTKHLLLLAGDRFYGLDGSERTCDGNFKTFATLYCHGLDGKLLGQSILTNAPVTGDKLPQVRSQAGWDTWPFSYGFPFTVAGNRLYVRSFDSLICIGAK